MGNRGDGGGSGDPGGGPWRGPQHRDPLRGVPQLRGAQPCAFDHRLVVRGVEPLESDPRTGDAQGAPRLHVHLETKTPVHVNPGPPDPQSGGLGSVEMARRNVPTRDAFCDP